MNRVALGTGLGVKIAAALGAIVLLAGCAPEPLPPAPEPEVLTASEAGGLYLDAVCPVNEAWDQADVEFDLLRIGVARGETDTSRIGAELAHIADASLAAAESLGSPDVKWPATAAASIAAVQRSLELDAAEAEKVAVLPAVEIVEHTWARSESSASAARQARAELGLPEDPVFACTEWASQ